jgi:hypothetical protein
LFFWFKKKEITLDCFTHSHSAYELAKPDFAYKFFPDWFTQLKKTVSMGSGQNNELSTIKHCQAFKKYYTSNTIILPTPCMLEVELGTNKNPYFTFKSSEAKVNVKEHLNLQFENMVDSSYKNLKIMLPWKLKTNKYVDFLWSDPIWNRSNVFDYTVMPGVVDYKYQYDTPANIFVKYKDVKQKLIFTLGTPLVILAPLNDCNIKIQHHMITDNKFDYFGDFAGVSQKKYVLKKQIIEAAEKRDAMKKCPFHLR